MFEVLLANAEGGKVWGARRSGGGESEVEARREMRVKEP